jgi:hypothetical protein
MTTNGFEVMTSNSTSTFVVTGGSSGIGRATVLELARSGHHVYAAARRERELRALSEPNPGITGLRVDVTDPASVVAARSTTSLDYTGTTPSTTSCSPRASAFRPSSRALPFPPRRSRRLWRERRSRHVPGSATSPAPATASTSRS